MLPSSACSFHFYFLEKQTRGERERRKLTINKIEGKTPDLLISEKIPKKEIQVEKKARERERETIVWDSHLRKKKKNRIT